MTSDQPDPEPGVPDFPFEQAPMGRPPARYGQLRAACPLSRVRTPFGSEVWLALDSADIKAVLQRPEFSRDFGPDDPRFSAEDLGDGQRSMLNQDPPEHTRLRRIVDRAFTRDRMREWLPVVRDITDQFVDSMQACRSPADLMHQVAFPLPVRIICRMLGISEDAAPQFRAWSDALLSVSTATAEQRRTAMGEFGEYIASLVAWQRREGEPGTLMADLVEARDGADRLSEEELVRTVSLIIMAGHETSAHVIGRGVLALLRTDQWRRLVADPKLIPGAVEEILRLEVPGHGGMLRLATADVKLPSGAVVPAGDAVIAPTVAFNHDPATFPDPLRLDLGRPNAGRHITFGAGPHFCLGAHLARVEVQGALEVLCARLPRLALAVPEEDLTWIMGSKISGLVALPVQW